MPFKKSNISELVDRIIEATAKVFKIGEVTEKQEILDSKDDKRRADYRVRLDDKLARLENQLYGNRIEEAKATLKEIRTFEEAHRLVEDDYEALDDAFRELNVIKYTEAIKELRAAAREFEERHIDEIRDERETYDTK